PPRARWPRTILQTSRRPESNWSTRGSWGKPPLNRVETTGGSGGGRAGGPTGRDSREENSDGLGGRTHHGRGGRGRAGRDGGGDQRGPGVGGGDAGQLPCRALGVRSRRRAGGHVLE